jgi:hypothetical protein
MTTPQRLFLPGGARGTMDGAMTNINAGIRGTQPLPAVGFDALAGRAITRAGALRDRIFEVLSREWRDPERRIDVVIATIAMAVGLYSVVTLLAVGYAHYLPMPWTGDPWGSWNEYLRRHDLISFLFTRHNEHYIPVLRLVILADAALVSGDGRLLLASSYAAQFGSALILFRLASRSADSALLRVTLLGTILALTFAAGQWMNFACTFQACWPIVFFTGIGAFWALQRAVEASRSVAPYGARWIAASIGFALLSVGTMANGLLVLPLLSLSAFWHRLPKRVALGLGVFGAIVVLVYMRGDPIRNPVARADSVLRTPELLVFTLAFLGSAFDEPVIALTKAVGLDWQSYRIVIAALAGGTGVVWLLRLAVAAMSEARAASNARLTLLAIVAFLALSGAMTAYGRVQFPMIDVLTSRYVTPSLLFWAGLVSAAMPGLAATRVRAAQRRWHIAIVAGAALVGVTIQLPKVAFAAEEESYLAEAEYALINNLFVPEAWQRFNYRPGTMIPVVRHFRSEHLASFSAGWTHWIGEPVTAHFVVGPTDSDCVGGWESVARVGGSFNPAVAVVGWGFDRRAARAPDRVVLVDGQRRIAGYATTTRRRPDLVALFSELTTDRVGWAAFLPAGIPSDVTAYLVLRDRRTLCRVGGGHIPGHYLAAPAAQAGAPLSGIEVKPQGNWASDVLPPGAGAPRFAGTWSSHTLAARGTLRVGPVSARGGQTIGLPLITGANAAGIRISAIERSTSEILTATNPPAGSGAWDLWRLDVPPDVPELTFDYTIEAGGGPDAWIVVGLPRVIGS